MGRSQKKRSYHPISVDIDGQTYHGEWVIEGQRKLDQFAVYGERCLVDRHGYQPREKGAMEICAREMLRRLVREAIDGRMTMSQPKSKYGL